MEGLLILAVIVGGVAGIVAVAKKSSAVNALRPLAKFESGKYLGGLPGQLIPTPKTTTVISTDAITFLSEWGQNRTVH